MSAISEAIAAAKIGDLEIARELIRAGARIFTARPALTPAGEWLPTGGHNGCGYWLPKAWELKQPDESVIDHYQEGHALCWVQDGLTNALDTDPRNGGDVSRAQLLGADLWPRVYGVASTPSGGTHELVAPLRVGSSDGFMQGLDLKGAKPDGQSRGFIFIAPTVKLSKTTYALEPYRWIVPPMLEEMDRGDDSGLAIAAMILEKQRHSGDRPEPQTYDGPPYAEMHEGGQESITRWVRAAVLGIENDLRSSATWPIGYRDEHGRGWERFQADKAWRLGQLARAGWNQLTMDQARAAFMGSAPAGDGWSTADAREKFDVQSTRGKPADLPTALQGALAAPVARRDEVSQVGEMASAIAGADDPGGDEVVEPGTSIRDRFPRADLAALLRADRPPREWVVAGLIPAGASVSFIAPAGHLKSLTAMGAGIAVARGDRLFAGLPITTRRVLYIDMENTEDDWAERLTSMGVTVEDTLDRFILIHLPPLSPLDGSTGAAELAAILDEYGMEKGDVVVLDSLQRVTTGAENDSDTLRAFYLHTAVMLKRRQLTVLRLDNTGKVTDKGARGSSGKRDDVDVELHFTRDAQKQTRLTIRPGKVRLRGVEPVVIEVATDEDGRLTFSTASDPFRVQVGQVHILLERFAIPVDAGERKALDIIKKHGATVVRAALRTAIKERRDYSRTAPSTDGAPPPQTDLLDRADVERRTTAHPPENGDSERENRAADERRTNGAPVTDASQVGAPPLPLSKERRTGAFDDKQTTTTSEPAAWVAHSTAASQLATARRSA